MPSDLTQPQAAGTAPLAPHESSGHPWAYRPYADARPQSSGPRYYLFVRITHIHPGPITESHFVDVAINNRINPIIRALSCLNAPLPMRWVFCRWGGFIFGHYYEMLRGPLPANTIRAVSLSFIEPQSPPLHSGIAGRIDPAPCSITHSIMLVTGDPGRVVSRILRHADAFTRSAVHRPRFGCAGVATFFLRWIKMNFSVGLGAQHDPSRC